MKHNWKSKESDSATAPSNRPLKRLQPLGRLETPRSEKEFLRKKASIARSATVRTAQDLTESTLKLLNPAFWARFYPWKTLGAVAVTGFVVGGRIVAAPGKSSKPEKPLRAPSSPPLSSVLINGAVEVLKSTLTSFLQQQIHRKQKPTSS